MDNKSIVATMIYGRPFPEVGTCVCHGKPVTEGDFKNEVSKKEYLLSRMCQKTQDEFFDSNSDGDDI